ncbi:uncharacterized protein F5Z01DRAFT_235297 [Emericellopsis atlantica]|uniref:Mannosyl transferase n=1 Tax=Emericellopsis atlantica TaxID=2614577 RepID=A0A9P7ZI25_9HYPO|nr:uncharacterized protein F5Z01DRAFT_235297 [Emericellopsis atlantica]KAG9252187.1 hypothetical protein F5Z01DRAFT_235297 [Emericellopsis atlantica]
MAYTDQLLSTPTAASAVLFGIVVMGICIVLRLSHGRRAMQQPPGRAPLAHPGSEKAGGPCVSQEIYKTPTPPPYPDWSVVETKPLPYRAFRYGPKYQMTMGLRTIHPHQWIELDNQFPKYHADKAARIEERGDKCVKTAPEAFDAAIELLEELTDYLPARYPSLYKRTHEGIDNLWSGESFNIVERPLKEDPMAICARLVQDDLAVLLEQPDGQYRLLAGSILLAGFWRLSDKFGMTLSDVHTSGDVPHFREKLETGMNKFFRRMKCDTFHARNNYFFQVDDCLGWSSSMGDEDAQEVVRGTAQKDKAIEHHWFRSERQTLRRLPKTRAVVFTIRTYLVPVTEMAREPYVPGRLASAVRSWDELLSNYKGKEEYGAVLLDYLDEKHKEQVDNGLDLEKEDEVRSYPW